MGRPYDIAPIVMALSSMMAPSANKARVSVVRATTCRQRHRSIANASIGYSYIKAEFELAAAIFQACLL
jgi:hypothetical protein